MIRTITMDFYRQRLEASNNAGSLDKVEEALDKEIQAVKLEEGKTGSVLKLTPGLMGVSDLLSVLVAALAIAKYYDIIKTDCSVLFDLSIPDEQK